MVTSPVATHFTCPRYPGVHTEGNIWSVGTGSPRSTPHSPLPEVRTDVIIRSMGDTHRDVVGAADQSATAVRTFSTHSRGARRPWFAAAWGTELPRPVRSAQAAAVPNERI